jgi:hypothetical protein
MTACAIALVSIPMISSPFDRLVVRKKMLAAEQLNRH